MRWMIFMVLVGFAVSLPAVALGQTRRVRKDSDKKAEEVKKKAHEDIKKWVKGAERKEKGEVQLYDTMVKNKIPSEKALKMMKTIIGEDLDIKGLDHYMRRATKAGVRGTVLEKRMATEVKAQVKKKAEEEKKKAEERKKAEEKKKVEEEKTGGVIRKKPR
jgi:unconventional prefoldin RPB5 interactor 1